MEIVVETVDKTNENNTIDTLFSYLDKGIDDMETGRLHTVDEAFQIVKDRLASEL